ncbi:hypothetical protein HWV07_10365 [Natronomonas salina]|uniref:hypothetical protein n=1 Tax=Natronomonas salina TaxID=1710540 RepID=UPI0015B6EA0B|nr:hypothetical protein [Natronomonas salina]QLD89410.1 hypothetical protein HWV07_10365 [Natronomonas salina]
MNLLDLFGGAGETDEVRAVATALAGMERDLHDAVQDHYEALGVDPPTDRQPVEERVEELCLLVEHHFQDDLWGFYAAEQAPEALENAEAARAHAGKSDAAWAETIEEWAEKAGSDDDVEAGGAERERADRYARDRFGVDLETFERHVVGWSRERTLKNALRAPIDADVRRIRLATEVIEELEE